MMEGIIISWGGKPSDFGSSPLGVQLDKANRNARDTGIAIFILYRIIDVPRVSRTMHTIII